MCVINELGRPSTYHGLGFTGSPQLSANIKHVQIVRVVVVADLSWLDR